MCGIAGGHHLSQDDLAKMLERLHHRGPDDRASFNAGNVALGMVRLAIQDLDHGQQPFVSTCGNITAICNGELYNWKELRAELEACGHRFATQCDCEILPAAWLEWGTALPEKLNGMFAFAIYDARDQSLFLARDRCGQKPLYLTTRGPFRFASEVKALAAAGVTLTPDPRHLASWLALRYLPEPQTLFAGIETLPAAHSLHLKPDGSRSLRRYWSAPVDPKPAAPITSLAELDDLARSSVELALQSDVPIAAYLSAGVDSSLLVHYARDLGADFITTSLSFGSASDEGPAATEFARSLGLTHEAATLTPASLHDLPRVISQMDRPIGDALILAFDHLASHTRALGAKVALGGEGPDEVFAGYAFQKALLTAQRSGSLGRQAIGTALAMMPNSLLNRLSGFPADLGPQGQRKVAGYFRTFAKKTSFAKATELHSLFEPDEINRLLSPDLCTLQVALTQFDEALSPDPFLNALALQYRHWLPDWSLIRQDKHTMAHSLEYRAPFLDHRLIDFGSRLPTSLKIHRGTDKYLWRQLAARHLPRSVTHRPKQPFYLPLEQADWRNELISLARDILSPAALADQGWFAPQEVEKLFSTTHFLPLKKLAALVILQLWTDTLR